MASRTQRAAAQLGRSVEQVGRSVGQVEEAFESLATALGDALGDRLPALAEHLADRFPDVADQLVDRLGDRVPGLQRFTTPRPSPGENALAFIGGLLAGALVGGVAAVFLAPSDGKTFRARLQARVDELMGYTLPPEPVEAPEPAEPADAPTPVAPFAPVAPPAAAPG
jgi:hypothetical protein